MRVAIVEDDKQYAQTLYTFLEKYQSETNQVIKIDTFRDGEDIVVNYSGDYDIILMDIEMKFMDGMTAATKIRQMDNEVVIIFITNMPQYVMEGYKVDALDYVLKPMTYFALSQRIDRAIKRMRNRKSSYMTIPVKGGMYKVDLSRIQYVEVQNHDSIIHTLDMDYETKLSLTNIEKMIQSDAFFRCHKCYLVNLEFVDGIQNSDIIIGEHTIQVSRARKKDFLDALNNYINEVSK